MSLETSLIGAAGGNYYLVLMSVVLIFAGYMFQWALRTIVSDNKEALKVISVAVSSSCQTGASTNQACARIETKVDRILSGDVR